jgi:hypothetical protein
MKNYAARNAMVSSRTPSKYLFRSETGTQSGCTGRSGWADYYDHSGVYMVP